MISRARPSSTGSNDPAAASVVSPAPARAAAVAASSAAPVLPREPATTRTCPKVPLFESRGRGGSIRPTSPASRRRIRGATAATASAGMPMSTTSRAPHSSAPG